MAQLSEIEKVVLNIKTLLESIQLGKQDIANLKLTRTELAGVLKHIGWCRKELKSLKAQLAELEKEKKSQNEESKKPKNEKSEKPKKAGTKKSKKDQPKKPKS
jgi:hypothetical protein